MFDPNRKRLLALDGGGIMGCITLPILARIERDLREATGNSNLLLRDFFDYIGGTSTGAIIAAGLAIGKSVEEVSELYRRDGAAMFTKAPLLDRVRHRYEARQLGASLKSEFGEGSIHALMQDGSLLNDRHLLVVTRNVNTDSPWPISTNPKARFNDLTRPDCNLQIPLWQLVRASTAAPTYFEPERLQWNPGDPESAFYFEDGGVTPYNNPAFLLYRMATLPEYQCGWPDGEDRMMLVSIGTGTRFRVLDDINPRGQHLIGAALTTPSVLMRGIAVEVDICCRQIGRCVHGVEIDLELDGMMSYFDEELGAMERSAAEAERKAFLYARYDPDISPEGLVALGLKDIDADKLAMDNVAMIDDLFRIGEAVAQSQVDFPGPFAAFLEQGTAS